jgi:glycosyltransferase involved in cell wall biosynthesis
MKDNDSKCICIDARLVDGSSGGVQQFVMGLAGGLGALTDGTETYYFLTYAESQDWLRPLLGSNCHILTIGSGHSGVKRAFKKRLPFSKSLWLLYRLGRLRAAPRGLDEKLRELNIGLVHFTHQAAFTTSIPSIYHPHDLLHIHFPSFCSGVERIWRSRSYSYFCEQAKMVSVASTWVKNDLIKNLSVPSDKIHVIPLAPPILAGSLPPDQSAPICWPPVGIPDQYLFYPAMFWPHKNHLNLIRALGVLKRQRGIIIPTVFSGGETPFKSTILQAIADEGLESSIHIAGYIPHDLIASYFKNARVICIPTLFEAGSFPAWEAFHMQVPLACSNVTSLPAQIGKGAIFFHPDQPEEIAEAIEKVWTDESIRAELVKNGLERLKEFNWQHTAKEFRALYRLVSGWELSDEDTSLLNAPPLM